VEGVEVQVHAFSTSDKKQLRGGFHPNPLQLATPVTKETVVMGTEISRFSSGARAAVSATGLLVMYFT
jgi:hypothetical protein